MKFISCRTPPARCTGKVFRQRIFVRSVISLQKKKHILAAQHLKEKFSALMRSMCRDEPLEEDRRTAFILTPDRITALRDCLFLLRQTQKQLALYLPQWISYRLEAAENILNLFFTTDRKYILYIQYDRAGAPPCAASREIPSN